MNSGGIHADINAGPITYGKTFSVQPFANVLVTMDMTGHANGPRCWSSSSRGATGCSRSPPSLTYTRTRNRTP